MAVFYKLHQEKRKESKFKGQWYARAVATETVNTMALADIMQQNCTLKRSDIVAVIAELVDVMKQQLQDSKRIKLDGLGTFKIGLNTKPAAKAEGETAVSALLKKASGALGKGDLDGAAAYLENAQRLDPKNSKILYDIANIRYHQGRYKEAESMASRAVQTGGNNAMLKKSWSLISNSRNKLGDSQGAVQAATKAASY